MPGRERVDPSRSTCFGISTAITLASIGIFAISATGVLFSSFGLAGMVSLKTVSIASICTNGANPVTLVLSILGILGKVGMTPIAGATLAFSGVGVITGTALFAFGSSSFAVASCKETPAEITRRRRFPVSGD